MPRTKKNLTLPLIPLRGLVILPNSIVHFDLSRESSVAALSEAMGADQTVFLATQKDETVEEPGIGDLYAVGTVAKIRQVMNLPGSSLRVLAEGVERAELKALDDGEHCRVAKVVRCAVKSERGLEMTAMMRQTCARLEAFMQASGRVSEDLAGNVRKMKDPGRMADTIAANALSELNDRVEILSQTDPFTRLEKLCVILDRETELSLLENDIQGRLKEQVDKSQKEYYLREQIKIIQEELGDKEPDDTYDLGTRIENAPISDEAREKLKKELRHMNQMAPGMPEIAVSRAWIETVLDLPWGIETTDNLDLKHARDVLNEDHYALEKVKERIIEYLAVRRRQAADEKDKAFLKAPILCFVGPPGVGKTSIVQAIAHAVGRKYVRMSLGGVRDEAEIRGHRRTYVGAMPGRIITGMKQAGSMNPLFLFDEIDKMTSDFRGDPASAMLEVLDGEQNHAFRDHYLDMAFDLSRVMFIATANVAESIPAPLLDRMEIIEVPSYTEEEKLHIAQKHLLPKQLRQHGVKASEVTVRDPVMTKIIENYTREAGVRELERMIGSIVRKSVVEMEENKRKRIDVTMDRMEKYLGAPRYLREAPERKDMVGVVNGLAYTAVGGETLLVECAVMKGTGQLSLTGHLGDVMQESARAALSLIRSNSDTWQIPPETFKEKDIHIHVPEGAVPKDGPSAGVTIFTAMVSALTGRPVRQDVAMTGEITLRGRVLPIGGVKEKLLAAYRAGITQIVMPTENTKDLEDIPADVLKSFSIHYAASAEDVLRVALAENMPVTA